MQTDPRAQGHGLERQKRKDIIKGLKSQNADTDLILRLQTFYELNF